MVHYKLGVVPAWQWDVHKEEKKGDYRVTIKCPNCDGEGHFLVDTDLSSGRVYECTACDNKGTTSFAELSELYENTAELLEDYPDAVKIERIA